MLSSLFQGSTQGPSQAVYWPVYCSHTYSARKLKTCTYEYIVQASHVFTAFYSHGFDKARTRPVSYCSVNSGTTTAAAETYPSATSRFVKCAIKMITAVLSVWSLKPTEGSTPQLLQLQCSRGAKALGVGAVCTIHETRDRTKTSLGRRTR